MAERRRLVRLSAMLMLAGLALVWPGGAGGRGDAEAAAAPQVLSDADQAELRDVEQYLNSVKTLRTGFVQTSSNGEVSRGTLYLSRPGRLRIDYDPPVPIQVVANGNFLVYFDRSLEQVSYVPLSSTPASVLLEGTISLSDPQLQVTGIEHEQDVLQIRIVRTKNEGEGSITLSFLEDPLALFEWTVIDAQGLETSVSLREPVFNEAIDAGLFQFKDPRPQQGPRP